MFANSLEGVAKNPGKDIRFRTLDKDRRELIVTQNKDMMKFGQERRKMETLGLAAGDHKDAKDAKKDSSMRNSRARRSPDARWMASRKTTAPQTPRVPRPQIPNQQGRHQGPRPR